MQCQAEYNLNAINEAGYISNEDFDKLVKIYSKFGLNYPTAVSNALYDLTGKRIDTPNDLLGISYIKTILKNNYNIKQMPAFRLLSTPMLRALTLLMRCSDNRRLDS